MKRYDDAYNKQVANILQRFCEDITKESGATGVKIICTFRFQDGKGKLSTDTFTTPDAKTERMLDPDVLTPRGSKLQQDAVASIRKSFLAAEIAVQQNTSRRQALFEQRAKELLAESPKLSIEEKTRRWRQLVPLLELPATR